MELPVTAKGLRQVCGGKLSGYIFLINKCLENIILIP